ncbi:hypothetical protein [Dyella sp. ASV21]|jgi:hypothetical protein|uniref:hypothetical protein n=1 Tax=Dyella sp. ASV21 TaxID=2795114 RepID=UPI0018EBD4B8|nr:hypothetical protein [Dyella sp. ASV21]
MAGHLHALIFYTVLLGFFTTLAMFLLQLRTYWRVDHRSLVVLAASSGLGMIYSALILMTLVLASDMALRWFFYVAGALFLTAQCAIGVWGTASLFRAFEKASAERR